jgi:hypothetical protein
MIGARPLEKNRIKTLHTKIVGGEGHLDAVLRERELPVGELAGIVSVKHESLQRKGPMDAKGKEQSTREDT